MAAAALQRLKRMIHKILSRDHDTMMAQILA